MNLRIRLRIATDAARRMRSSPDLNYALAKHQAARLLCPDGIAARDLPSDGEVREELELLVPGLTPIDAPAAEVVTSVDRFRTYRLLLTALEPVQQSRRTHPEGDALYHSLQVFDLAREELPYDEEFLLAALLHDVGKAISPGNHVVAGLEALSGTITERTSWFIEHHPDAHALRGGTLGVRSLRRLQASPDFEELLMLGKCDRQGRQIGVLVPDVDEALAYVAELAAECGEE
ncbi:MAG: HD domain-containing protein [Planctomycetia bacterium]|nr:HD domain-containing protein [Planctomycetia bacterium]